MTLTEEVLTKLKLEGGLRLPSGAKNGEALTSDAEGNATWKPPGGAVGAWTELEAVNAKFKAGTVGQTLRVRAESGGAVARLRGTLEAGSEIASGSLLFILPVIFRPLGMSFFRVTLLETSGFNIRIETNGEVITLSKIAATQQVDFRAEWSLT